MVNVLLRQALRRADILELLPNTFTSARTIDRAANALKRFLLGDGHEQGYVFSHPALAVHFRDRLQLDGEFEKWHERYVAFGLRTLERLATNQLSLSKVSPYAVRHLGEHLYAIPATSDLYHVIYARQQASCRS